MSPSCEVSGSLVVHPNDWGARLKIAREQAPFGSKSPHVTSSAPLDGTPYGARAGHSKALEVAALLDLYGSMRLRWTKEAKATARSPIRALCQAALVFIFHLRRVPDKRERNVHNIHSAEAYRLGGGE